MSDAGRRGRIDGSGHRLGPYEILAPLNHPNIITIYEIGRADSVYCISMELI